MYTVYGIPNCNTVKKSLDWLKKNKINFEFYDYKKNGITASKLKEWSKQAGWENLVNKKGSTWRQLDEGTKESITNQKNAIELMQEKTSIIKRPLIESDGRINALGFDEEMYKKVFGK
jgi:Spx/MgsR family transcriptional regulator